MVVVVDIDGDGDMDATLDEALEQSRKIRSTSDRFVKSREVNQDVNGGVYVAVAVNVADHDHVS